MTVDAKLGMIYTLLWIDVAAYIGLLYFGVRNTAKYIIGMGKWKHFFLAMFYFFSLILTVSRLLFFVTNYLEHIEDYRGYQKASKANGITSFTSFYSRAALGIFQIGTMNELSIKLKHAATLITEQQAKKYLQIN